MKKIILILTIAAVSAFFIPAVPGRAAGEVLYVSASSGSDSEGDGSRESPFESLGRALGLISGGGSIAVLGGIGDENLDGLEFDEPVQIGLPDSELRAAGELRISGCRNITFRGMVFSGAGSGVCVSDSENIVFSECDFLGSAGLTLEGGKNISLDGCGFDGGSGLTAGGTEGLGLSGCLFLNLEGTSLSLKNVKGSYLSSSGEYGTLWECRFFGGDASKTAVLLENSSDIGLEGGQISGFENGIVSENGLDLYLRRLNIYRCHSAVSLTSSRRVFIDSSLFYSNDSYISLYEAGGPVDIKDSAFLSDRPVINIPPASYSLYGITESGLELISPSVHRSVFSFGADGVPQGINVVTGIRASASDGVFRFEPDVNRAVFKFPNTVLNPYLSGRALIRFVPEETGDLGDISVTEEALPLGNSVPVVSENCFSPGAGPGSFVSDPFDCRAPLRNVTLSFSLHERAAVDCILFYPDIEWEAVLTGERTVDILLGDTSAAFGELAEGAVTVTGAKNCRFTAERISYRTVRLTFDKKISSSYKNLTVSLDPSVFIAQYGELLAGYDMLGRSPEEQAELFGYSETETAGLVILSSPVTKPSSGRGNIMAYVIYAAAGAAVLAAAGFLLWYFLRDRFSIGRYVRKGKKAFQKRRLSRKYK